MLRKHGRGGTVEIDGFKYDWELLSDPQLSSSDGWKGMRIALRQHNMAREAVMEFPAPKRLLKGLPKGRLHINDTIASRGVRAALSAGWDPHRAASPSCSWSMPTAIERAQIVDYRTADIALVGRHRTIPTW